ncbi:Uncharacterised protein [uncultured archaeon]|nr:Uncharacterised protein [uncultured archaeon]
MKDKKPEIRPLAGIRTDAIDSIEGRFGFEGKVIADIEKTKMQIAHPGWVQLTSAGHPVPALPPLVKPPLLLPKMEKRVAEVKPIGLSISLPEIGERKKAERK